MVLGQLIPRIWRVTISVDDLNQRAIRLSETANTRVHGTTKEDALHLLAREQ